jgi:electron transport complex protein RnfD
MAWEVLFTTLFRRESRIFDGSAALCGLLLSMLMPPLIPWWTVVIASCAAMFLGKQLFGGAGGSPFNAVCVGWAVIAISWPNLVDPSNACIGFTLPFENAEFPLSVYRRLGAPAFAVFPVKALLFGKQAGCIGTGASLLLLAGGTAGVLLGLIPWVIPVAFSTAVAVTAMMFIPEGPQAYIFPVFQLFTGYTIIGAFFLATDFSSRPVSFPVMALYGAVGGVLTVLFRMWSVFPEGLPFALLIINMAVPLLDRGTHPGGNVMKVLRL